MMDFTHLISSLKQNKLTSQRLVLTPRIPDSDIAKLVAALQENQSLRHIDLLCSGDFRPSACRWQVLLKAVLGLPYLESFQMRGCSTANHNNTEANSIPISSFSSVASKHLSSFSLAQLVLSCEDPDDFQAFASAMKERPELREFLLVSVGLLRNPANEEEEDITTLVLQPLLENLAELPQLENLEVSGTFTPLGVLKKAPLNLFQSKSLKRLSVSDFIFPESALSSIWKDLSKNSILKELAISGNFSHKVAPGFTQLMSQNKTLEAIALRVDHFDDEACNQELIKAIGLSHLKVVSLCSFFGGDLSQASRDAFVRMVHHNCSLEFLYAPCPYTDFNFWEPVRVYLGLNAAGRRRTIRRPPVLIEESKNEEEVAFPCKSSTRPVSPDVTTSKPTVVSPVGKRHQEMVQEARRSKKQRLDAPTRGLSSMLIR